MNEYGIEDYLSLIRQGRYDKIGRTAIDAMAKQIEHLERDKENLPIQNVRHCYSWLQVVVACALTAIIIVGGFSLFFNIA